MLFEKINEKYVKLNSGYLMPKLGLGTWTLKGDICENVVYAAIKDGYRLIDTAQLYENEVEIGKAVNRAIEEKIVKREELFVTTKILTDDFEKPECSYDESLKRLNLDYIDLVLIHKSGEKDNQLYHLLCNGVAEGKIKSVGLSNYYTDEKFENVIKGAPLKPCLIQNENHIFYQNNELQKYVSRYGTYIQSCIPFGGRRHIEDSLGNEILKTIAIKYNKTVPQIILRWHIQLGYLVVPGSANIYHNRENISVFDFQLSTEDMKMISSISTNTRYANW